VPVRNSSIAVVTVNYRTPALTKRCIAAVAKERKGLPRLRAVVVDGGSADGSAAELSAALAKPAFASWVEFMPLPINGGFGWANNQAIQRLLQRAEPPEFIHLLNPDTEIEPDAIRFLADYLLRHPRIAAVGSQLIDPDGSNLEQLTFDESFDGFPMFSPDGKKLVWASNRNDKNPGETNLFIAEWK